MSLEHRIKLLMCSSSMDGGGSERQMLYLLQNLDRRRFDLSLYLLYRTGSLLPEVPQDIPIYAYWDCHNRPRINWPGRIYRSQVKHLASVIRENTIELTYDRLFHMALITGPATARTKTRRVSSIVSPPSFDVMKTEKKWIQRKKRILKESYESASILTTVSQGTADDAARFYEIEPRRFVVVPSPVDIESISIKMHESWAHQPLHRDSKNIVSVGRLSNEKGHRYLIEGVAKYLRNRVDSLPMIYLHLIGDGVRRAELIHLAHSLGIGDRVIFHGHVANPFPLLKDCDLFVLPSLYEGLPNALLEAMVCKLPILATDTNSGAGEILRSHPIGSLVPTQDSDEIAKAIRSRFEAPDFWLERLEPAYQFVVKNHSLSGWLSRMTQILQEASRS